MALSEGEMVGQYRVVSQLGFGGMATVYKAYHPRLDRHVAIKMMHQAFQDDRTFLARFEREAQIVARLEHPHIVPVYDFAEHNGQPYLVMKYVEGRTLKQLLNQAPPSLNDVIRIMKAVSGGIDYAHHSGVLHRDIKPSNIILANDGTPYITDFGLARMASLNESTLSADVLLGTPHYISPEQAMGSRDLTPATDLYSLGVVLYELVVGRVPYTSDTPFAVIHSHIYSPLPKPSAINPEISPEVEVVLIKALSKQPGDRYPTAAAMMDAFTEAAAASGLKDLNPDRVQIAGQRIDHIQTVGDSNVPMPAATGGTAARLERLSAPANDPDTTTAPAPLPRADEFDFSGVTPAPTASVSAAVPGASAPSAPRAPTPPKPTAPNDSARVTPSSAFPVPPPMPRIPMPTPPGQPVPPMTPGNFAAGIGSLAANAARFAAETAARAANEASSEFSRVWQEERGRGRAGERPVLVHRRGDGTEVAGLSGDRFIIRTPGGGEIRFSAADSKDEPWWKHVSEGKWDEALEEIIHENDELAPAEDRDAARRRAVAQVKRQRGFAAHLLVFILVNLMLLVIADGGAWVLFVLLGWGSGLAAHGVDTFYRTGAREARRIAAIRQAYSSRLGTDWERADPNTLKRIRRDADRPFRKRREFYSHAAVYAMINLMLIGIADGGTWPLIVLFGWGIGLAAQAVDTFGWGGAKGEQAQLDRIIERERAATGESIKHKNDELSDSDVIDSPTKHKNDERPSVRLNSDGEFTDSMVEDARGRDRRRGRR